MKFKTLNILVYLCLMINLGFENEQDSSANLEGKADQQPLKPLPFYFDFASRGFDVTTQSLFGDLSPGNLKNRIFKLDYIDGTPKLKSRKELRTRSELPRFGKDLDVPLANHYRIDFFNGDQMKLLLDPLNAAFIPGNYSDNLKYLIKHCETMFESIVFFQNSFLEVKADVDDVFLKDLKNLPIEYTTTTSSSYENFIKTYGTHYFRRVDFGGAFRILGARVRIDGDSSVENYKTVFKADTQRFIETMLKAFSGQTNLDSYHGGKLLLFNFDKLHTYGGKKFNIIEAEIVNGHYCQWLEDSGKNLTLTEWLISLHDKSVPIGGEIEPIYNLAAFEKVDEKIIKNLEKTIQIAIQKYKINSYIEGINQALISNYDKFFNFLNKYNYNLNEVKDNFTAILETLKKIEENKNSDKDFLENSQRIDSLVDQWSEWKDSNSQTDQYFCCMTVPN